MYPALGGFMLQDAQQQQQQYQQQEYHPQIPQQPAQGVLSDPFLQQQEMGATSAFGVSYPSLSQPSQPGYYGSAYPPQQPPYPYPYDSQYGNHYPALNEQMQHQHASEVSDAYSVHSSFNSAVDQTTGSYSTPLSNAAFSEDVEFGFSTASTSTQGTSSFSQVSAEASQASLFRTSSSKVSFFSKASGKLSELTGSASNLLGSKAQKLRSLAADAGSGDSSNSASRDKTSLRRRTAGAKSMDELQFDAPSWSWPPQARDTALLSITECEQAFYSFRTICDVGGSSGASSEITPLLLARAVGLSEIVIENSASDTSSPDHQMNDGVRVSDLAMHSDNPHPLWQLLCEYMAFAAADSPTGLAFTPPREFVPEQLIAVDFNSFLYIVGVLARGTDSQRALASFRFLSRGADSLSHQDTAARIGNIFRQLAGTFDRTAASVHIPEFSAVDDLFRNPITGAKLGPDLLLTPDRIEELASFGALPAEFKTWFGLSTLVRHIFVTPLEHVWTTVSDLRNSAKITATEAMAPPVPYLRSLSFFDLKPWREGWLKKQFAAQALTVTLYSKLAYHWTCAGGGFLWYFKQDDECFDRPERVVYLAQAYVARYDEIPNSFMVVAPGYQRAFAADSEDEALEWMACIVAQGATVVSKILHTHVTVSKQNEPATPLAHARSHIADFRFRYGSSLPVRARSPALPLVDGEETYFAMSEAISAARQTVFIADWFLSPQVYLRRRRQGVELVDPVWRLDRLIERKAQEGVHFYIMPWNETKIAMGLQSEYADKQLSMLHANVHVIRHPILAPLLWSHHQKICVVDEDVAFIGGLDLCYGRFDRSSHPLVDEGGNIGPCRGEHEHSHCLFPGKDYYNPMVRAMENVHQPFDDIVDRRTNPRMPWHDVHMCVVGQAARDVASNFIQRWNHHRDCVQAIQHPYLTPKFGRCGSNSPAVRAVFGLPSSENDQCTDMLPVMFASCQVLRSICDWSGGLAKDTVEASIYQAYLTAIDQAEHFIYIENQFFVSSFAGHPVENTMAAALLDRLRIAIRKKQQFRVIIVVPCHPDGRFADNATIKQVMRWQYRSLCRCNGQSLLERLTSEFPDVAVSDYFSINSLRQYGHLNARPVTEQIYVHSKCMIVDDRLAIIGSANINDRSLLARRDSEIAIAVGGFEKEDLDIESMMSGQRFRVNRFVHELRKKLWAEHLGLPWPAACESAVDDDDAISEHVGRAENTTHVDLTDPVCEILYTHTWRRLAAINSNIYRDIFPTAPHKNISSLAVLKSRDVTSSTNIACSERLEEIRGHLVQFATDFLRDETLEKISLGSLDLLFADDTIFT